MASEATVRLVSGERGRPGNAAVNKIRWKV